MRRGFRVIGLIVVLVAVVVAVQSRLGGVRSQSAATVEIISPPADVALPAGQAVEVRYRVAGPAVRAELWCDDMLLATEAAQAGQELAHAWVPAGLGAACCTVTELDGRGLTLASARRCLDVEPNGSPVRLNRP
ncbi:MAG: hypothetical protein NT169_18570 [Chloroflexi bacterium]|nr:hypothetical protein [Chloroflexota bacterium]